MYKRIVTYSGTTKTLWTLSFLLLGIRKYVKIVFLPPNVPAVDYLNLPGKYLKSTYIVLMYVIGSL